MRRWHTRKDICRSEGHIENALTTFPYAFTNSNGFSKSVYRRIQTTFGSLDDTSSSNLDLRSVLEVDGILVARPSRTNLVSPFQDLFILSVAKTTDQFFGDKIGTDRVLRELVRLHELASLLDSIEIVNLHLEFVPARVGVVHAGAHAVVDGPSRHDSFGFLLLVAGRQVGESLEGEGYVIDPARCSVCESLSGAGIFDDDHTVMFEIPVQHS